MTPHAYRLDNNNTSNDTTTMMAMTTMVTEAWDRGYGMFYFFYFFQYFTNFFLQIDHNSTNNDIGDNRNDNNNNNRGLRHNSISSPGKFSFFLLFLCQWLIHIYLQWLPRHCHLLSSLHHHSLKTPANHTTTMKGAQDTMQAPGMFFLFHFFFYLRFYLFIYRLQLTTTTKWLPSPYQDHHVMSHSDDDGHYQTPHNGNTSYNNSLPQFT